jgi:hypothetical protein
MNSASSTSLRKLRVPAYLAAFLLLVYPVLDTLVPALPLHPGVTQWRYAVVLALGGTIINPLLAMLILLGVSIMSEDRMITIAVSSVSVAATLILVIATGMYALDSVQLHGNVAPQMNSRFVAVSLWTLLRFASAALTMAIISVVGIGAVRRQSAVTAQTTGRSAMLVGTPARRPAADSTPAEAHAGAR